MAAAVQASVAAMSTMEHEAKRFAADVSHELRTPLSTLTAVTEVLADAADRMEPDARESAQLAITETQRLVTLMEDLMEVSRFDARTAHMHPDDVNLGEAVRASIRARGWLDSVEVSVEADPVLRLDRRRLDVIVANLVGNALRHGAPPVHVRVWADDLAVRVEVVDHGAGLPESVVAHVFDRFFKHDTARSRTPGSGLGLALARENARLHGGDVIADTPESGGARFVLVLPSAEGPIS
jgi:two-component system sensor histidine kinase MtrB